MALVVNGATVATAMSPIVEAGLYADEIFIEGKTFTSQYDVDSAGQIQVEKYSPDMEVKAKVPGSNFSDKDYKNTVITINTNNAFQYSQKVPAYFEATMPTSVKMNQTLRTTENVRIGRQKAGLAALVHGGTESTNNEAITETNFKEEFLKDRKILVDKFAKPNVAITSTEVYNIMLKLAGTEFTPSTNENVVTTGQVGYWMGILWIEAPLLGGSLSFLNESGLEQSVDTANIDYVLYDYKAYSIIDKLTMLRVIDSEEFAGSKIQEEIDTGFKVTNADCVLVRKHL